MKSGYVVNIITIDALIPGATMKKAAGTIEGFVDVTWNGQTRRFSEQLINQIPNKDVVNYIRSCFEVTSLI